MKLINLIATTDALELKLAGNVAATQADWTCSYYDTTTATGVVLEGVYTGTTNNTTAVVICASPAAGHVRTIKEITVYNADSGTIIPIIQFNANGTIRVVIRNSLTTLASRSVGDMSFYTDTSGFVSATGAATLTNKRIDLRKVEATSYTTDTGTSLSVATCDIFVVTAQSGALKLNNPGGTPVQGQKLIVRIKDNGTARALTYDTQFRAMGIALPSTTVLSKTLYLGFIYNNDDTKRDLIASSQEA